MLNSAAARTLKVPPAGPAATFDQRAIGGTAAGLFDAAAISIVVVTAAAAALTFRDYGLGWDDYTHSQYGNLLVSLYSSGFADKRAFSFVNLYMYGGGFDLLAALAAKILPFDLFETRRLAGACVGLIGLFVTWRLGRRLGGPIAGLIALALIATCPLYYGHMFMNAKDAPFAVAMAVALLGTVRAFAEYPRAAPATLALCGIGVGLAIGSRVMGGFALINIAMPLLVLVTLRGREIGFKPAASECRSFLVPFIPAAILAYLVMGLVWPWSVLSPLNPFRAVEYFSNFFEKPWRELFAGHLTLVPDMPRSYVPTLMVLTLPGLMLVLGLGGMIGAGMVVARGNVRSSAKYLVVADPGRRAALLAVMLAALLPVLVTVAARPAMYNGIRHFVFLTPPFAALGGLAGTWIIRRLQHYGRAAVITGAAILTLGIAYPAAQMARLHPYEYTFFNRFAGGVAGARPSYMIDYWGLSMTQASRQLRALLAKRSEAPPPGRKWSVAVCGPHPAVVVALGPQFSAIWDPNGADFAMMLGEFYCATLDAPVLVEIVRQGVVYARVYDIRGKSISSLLTYPNANQ